MFRALADRADFQEMVRVEVNDEHVAVFARDLELIRWRAVHVFGAERLDTAALGLPVYQRTVDVGIFDQRFRFVGRELFRVFASLERRYLPALGTIPRLDHGQPLQGGLGADLARTFFGLHVGEADLSTVDEELALRVQGLQGAQGIGTALGLDVFRHQFGHGQGRIFLGVIGHRPKEHANGEKGGEATRLHRYSIKSHSPKAEVAVEA